MVASRARGGVTLVIFDSRLTEMTLPGGITHKYVRNLAREVAEVAKANLYPGRGYRTGQLQRSIGYSATPIRPMGVLGSVRATAPYALYVHEGTRSVVKPPGQRYVFFGSPGTRWGGRKYVLKHHRGQRANPFLADAKRQVMAIRGIG